MDRVVGSNWVRVRQSARRISRCSQRTLLMTTATFLSKNPKGFVGRGARSPPEVRRTSRIVAGGCGFSPPALPGKQSLTGAAKKAWRGANLDPSPLSRPWNPPGRPRMTHPASPDGRSASPPAVPTPGERPVLRRAVLPDFGGTGKPTR